MPPHKWVDNAELSVPDQMTNITEKTRPQSYLQLSGRRPNTQDQFSTLGFTACITVCVGLLNVSQASKTMQTYTSNLTTIVTHTVPCIWWSKRWTQQLCAVKYWQHYEDRMHIWYWSSKSYLSMKHICWLKNMHLWEFSQSTHFFLHSVKLCHEICT